MQEHMQCFVSKCYERDEGAYTCNSILLKYGGTQCKTDDVYCYMAKTRDIH